MPCNMVADFDLVSVSDILTPDRPSAAEAERFNESRSSLTRQNLFSTTPSSAKKFSLNRIHIDDIDAPPEAHGDRNLVANRQNASTAWSDRHPLASRSNQLKFRTTQSRKLAFRKNSEPLRPVGFGKENAMCHSTVPESLDGMGDKAYVSLAKQVRDMYIKDRPNSFQSNEGKTSSFLRRPSPPQRAMSYPDESSMDSALGSPGRNGRSESLDSFQFSYFHNKPDVATNQYQPHQPLLPVVSRDKGVAYITPSTMADVLQGLHDDKFRSVHILDARFDYEYQGGHIQGAVHVPDERAFDEFMQAHILAPSPDVRPVCIIVHCEYSQQRGPQLFQYIRNSDRRRNLHRHPLLDHPELYVVQGGYRQFFEDHKTLCEPPAYVEMTDPRFKNEFKKHSKTLRKIKSFSHSHR